jgi:hypothetical protein
LGHKVEKYSGGHRTIGEIKNMERNIGEPRRNNMSGTRKYSGNIGEKKCLRNGERQARNIL